MDSVEKNNYINFLINDFKKLDFKSLGYSDNELTKIDLNNLSILTPDFEPLGLAFPCGYEVLVPSEFRTKNGGCGYVSLINNQIALFAVEYNKNNHSIISPFLSAYDYNSVGSLLIKKPLNLKKLLEVIKGLSILLLDIKK